MTQNELYHYGVLGMKWGVRKDPKPTGSITKNGKYKASNGVVIGKSKNAGAAIGRKLTTSKVGGALSAVGSMSLNKSQRDRMKKERAALKEYQKVGGDKMLSSKNPEAYIKYTKEKHKRAIKIGAAAAGTTLAVYGGYKISKHLKSKAGRLSYEMGKKYAEEHFFNKADIANPIKYQHLMDAGRQTLQNTDKRTKKVSKSTMEAIKFLRDPNSSIVDGELLRWH